MKVGTALKIGKIEPLTKGEVEQVVGGVVPVVIGSSTYDYRPPRTGG